MWLLELKGAEEHSKNTLFSFLPYMAQLVTNLHAMQETRGRLLGWKDALEEGMATHSSILAWRIPWTEELGRLQATELQRVGHS